MGRVSPSKLGLPSDIRACLFDLDGVLTNTAAVHATAWKSTFDDFLRERDGAGFRPFDSHADYDEYVDGKPRLDGVRDFLASRHIELSDDQVAELAERKNQAVQQAIERDGVEVFDGSVRYLQAVEQAGLSRIVVTASANAEQVLRVTGLQRYVQGRVDGRTLAEQHLAGKPKPDSFLAGARLLDLPPDAAAVFEDATAGVEAGHRGKFGYVIGVNRLDDKHGKALREHGADVVVTDLAELL